MAQPENNRKIVLLLQPQKLLYRAPVVQLLKVEKQGTQVEMDELPITTATVNQFLKHLDGGARAVVARFSKHELEMESMRIDLQLNRAGQTGDKAAMLRDKAMARYFLQYFSQLRPYQSKLSWYHRITQPGSNRVSTTPCAYQMLSVSLVFDCEATADGPKLGIWVKNGTALTPLSAYRRFYFLLLKENTYCHLNTAALEALEWLENTPISMDKLTTEQFMQQVVLPLKKMQQTVNTDKLIAKERLRVLPVRRLHLSELNNTFLMLTPQYLYDGQLIEGPFTAVTEKVIDGVPVEIERDETLEKEFFSYIQQLHIHFGKQRNGYFYLSFADAQKKHWFLKTYHSLLEENIEITGMDMLKHFRYSAHLAETRVAAIAQTENIIELELNLSFGKDTVPLGELQKMLWSGQKAVMLKDGSMGVLGEDWLQQYGTAIKHGTVKGKRLHIPRWLALGFDDKADHLGLKQTIAATWMQKWKQWSGGDEALYTLPPQVEVQQLRSYQQKGFDWMNLLAEAGGSACLADDMGLGKTLQTICFICNRLHQYSEGRHLVVAPASLIYTWIQEFEKFAPRVPAFIYHGNARDAAMLSAEGSGVIVTSYGTLRQDIALFGLQMFDTIVLDESHHIKNPATQVSKAVSELKGKTRIALSGTPVMNGTQDLYAQINFLLPGLLGSREFFRREYAIPIEQQHDQEKAKALQRIIAPFVLRRTKEQVAADLPPKTEMVMWCAMGQEQRLAYESIKEKIKSSILLDIAANGLNKGKMSVLAGLTKLRQACNSCELTNDEDLFISDSIKTEMLINELQQIIPTHKALVFSQFTSMLDLLERDLKQAGIACQRLDGSTDVKARQQLVNQFQEVHADEKVFLLSLKAGNAGLTLTAADYVFLFDPWWNAAVEQQAIDRTHRIGQNRQVFAYRMICKDTVEEKILKMQQRKQKLAEDLVSSDESFMQSLTLEDIQFLLS